jgi:hypothetical protein
MDKENNASLCIWTRKCFDNYIPVPGGVLWESEEIVESRRDSFLLSFLPSFFRSHTHGWEHDGLGDGMVPDGTVRYDGSRGSLASASGERMKVGDDVVSSWGVYYVVLVQFSTNARIPSVETGIQRSHYFPNPPLTFVSPARPFIILFLHARHSPIITYLSFFGWQLFLTFQQTDVADSMQEVEMTLYSYCCDN